MTLRQLVWMRDAKQRDQWNHTARLEAIVANAAIIIKDAVSNAFGPAKHRQKIELVEPSECHPFERLKVVSKKRKKSATQLLAKLAAFDGQQPQTVAEKTWNPKKP